MPEMTEESRNWPGKRLGLPETGPRSVARLGRRVAGIAIDWALATAIGYLFFEGDRFSIILVFIVMQLLFIVIFSGSIGHLLLGMRVVPLTPKWIGVIRPVVRTILLSLVLPAVIWDADQRGMHDKFAGTVLVRR